MFDASNTFDSSVPVAEALENQAIAKAQIAAGSA